MTVNELVEAEKLWIKDAQAELETDVKYAQLSNSVGLIEEDGILRFRGRLKNSDIEVHTKHPAIIPKDHKLTELIIEACHSDVFHCGERER